MRICVDLTSLADNFSGIERFALSITKELIKHEEHTWVLLFKNEIYKDFELVKAEKIVIKGNNKLLFNQLLLPLKLTKIRADKYFFPAFPAPFFFFKKNSYSTIHDLSCWDCPGSNKTHMIWYFKLMYWKVALNDKKIITVSEFSKKRITSILHAKLENIKVIYNGIDPVFFNPKLNDSVYKKYDLPENYFLCLSTLEPRKNLQLLINAYSKVCNDINVDLVLAGRKGWLMDNLLSNLPENVKEKIHFTGFIEDDDLPSIYGYAKRFVFPSLYEGFGIPPVEALASGTLVLSSDVTAMPEILGDSVLYFKNNDENDLKEKLIFITGYELNESQTSLHVEHALKYSWTDSANELLEFVKENN